MDSDADQRCGCGATRWVHAAVAQVDPRDVDDAADINGDAVAARRIVCGACGEEAGQAVPLPSSAVPATAREPALAWAALAGTATMMAMVIVLA